MRLRRLGTVSPDGTVARINIPLVGNGADAGSRMRSSCCAAR